MLGDKCKRNPEDSFGMERVVIRSGAEKTSEVPRGIKKDLRAIVNPAAPLIEVSLFPWRKPLETTGTQWEPGKEQERE